MYSHQLPNISQGSISKGICFVFNDELNTIKVWGSSLSGKEKVYLNGSLVSEKRNINFKGEHKFQNNLNNNYEVKILTISMLKGTIQCHLYKNGAVLKKQESRYIMGKFMNISTRLLLILASIALGVIAGLGYLQELGLYISLIMLIIVYLTVKKSGFIFEEV